MRSLAIVAALSLLAVPAAAEARSTSCVKQIKGWHSAADGRPVGHASNWVSLRAGLLLWNNVPVSEEQLLANLAAGRQTNPVTFVIFDPQSADCDFARRIQKLLDQNYPCRRGGCIHWTPPDPHAR